MGQAYDFQGKSDEQLLQLLRGTQDATGALAHAVHLELGKRGIDTGLVLSVEGEGMRYRSELAFDWYHKLGMLLFPLALIWLFSQFCKLAPPDIPLTLLNLPFVILCYYLVQQYLRQKGYHRMLSDFKAWTNYSLYIFIALLLLAGLALIGLMALRLV